jgi:hypothetical protein
VAVDLMKVYLEVFDRFSVVFLQILSSKVPVLAVFLQDLRLFDDVELQLTLDLP